jgi:hypothetical protein
MTVPYEADWETYRALDPIRAAALAAAVAHVGPYCYQDHEDGWTQVLDVAKEFERYLAGEEANATPHP